MPSASTTSRHPSPVARRRAAPTRAKASMRGLSSSAAANTATTTTSARYYGGGEPPPQQREARRPVPSQLNRSAAPTSTTPTRQQGQQQRPIARPQQQQARPTQPAQPLQEPPRAFLARSDVVDKQVIARTSGRCLGVVDHMLVDAETLRVSSVELRAKGLAAAAGLASAVGGVASSASSSSSSLSTWGARPEQQQQRLPSTSLQRAQPQQRPKTNLPLAAVCQVGDVVLVHDERALSPSPNPSSTSNSYYENSPPPRYVRLTGSEVVSADGSRLLGRVRGYGFDPETGELLALRYDALGSPRVPEGAMVVVEVPMSAVLSLDQSQQWGDPAGPTSVVLRPGAEDDGSCYVVSEGLLGLALAGLQALWDGGEGDDGYLDDDGGYEGAEAFGRGLRRGGASPAAAPASRRGRRGTAPSAPDPEFEEWRRVHGRVFARYYGLPSVPRTRAELDAAMASAASGGGGSPPQQQRQRSPRQQQERAALPPPSRSAFGDALRPSSSDRRALYETVDAFDDVAAARGSSRPPLQQRRPPPTQQQRAPPSSPPSSWPPPPPASSAEEAFWREQPPVARRQRPARGDGGEDAAAAAEARWGARPPTASENDGKPNGIPIIDMRPKPPEEIRDADGGFGGGGGAKRESGGGESGVGGAAAPPSTAEPKPVVSELSFGAPPDPEADGTDGSAW